MPGISTTFQIPFQRVLSWKGFLNKIGAIVTELDETIALMSEDGRILIRE
jgi:hypothetical protein